MIKYKIESCLMILESIKVVRNFKVKILERIEGKRGKFSIDVIFLLGILLMRKVEVERLRG